MELRLAESFLVPDDLILRFVAARFLAELGAFLFDVLVRDDFEDFVDLPRPFFAGMCSSCGVSGALDTPLSIQPTAGPRIEQLFSNGHQSNGHARNPDKYKN